jgi:hypothetical protein
MDRNHEGRALPDSWNKKDQPDGWIDIYSIYQILMKRDCPNSYIRHRVRREFDRQYQHINNSLCEIMYAAITLSNIEGNYNKIYKIESTDETFAAEFVHYFQATTNYNKIIKWINDIHPESLEIFTDTPDQISLPKRLDYYYKFVLDEITQKDEFTHGRLFVFISENGDDEAGEGYAIVEGKISKSGYDWDYGAEVPNGIFLGYDVITNIFYLFQYQDYSEEKAIKYAIWWIYDILERLSNDDDRMLFIMANIGAITGNLNLDKFELNASLDTLIEFTKRIKITP